VWNFSALNDRSQLLLLLLLLLGTLTERVRPVISPASYQSHHH